MHRIRKALVTYSGDLPSTFMVGMPPRSDTAKHAAIWTRHKTKPRVSGSSKAKAWSSRSSSSDKSTIMAVALASCVRLAP
jgi:hypothetical protein